MIINFIIIIPNIHEKKIIISNNIFYFKLYDRNFYKYKRFIK